MWKCSSSSPHSGYVPATLVIMVEDISRRGRTCLGKSKRFWQPSGPVSLPLILLALAKGYRINTVFPLSCIGPAILQLLQVSALTFDGGIDRDDVRYAFFEASTISGILHASLYLDSIILPYYTGFDALVSSTFSGECPSCVCRREVLVVGGRLIGYRGLSVTTFSVVGALCSRILCRLTRENRSKIVPIKALMESLGWVLITMDCIYLIRKSPEQSLLRIAAFGGVLVLICLHMMKKVSAQIAQQHSAREKLVITMESWTAFITAAHPFRTQVDQFSVYRKTKCIDRKTIRGNCLLRFLFPHFISSLARHSMTGSWSMLYFLAQHSAAVMNFKPARD